MNKKSSTIPKGYKLTKIGVLPVEWEVVKTQKICNILSGNAFSSKDYSDNENDILLLRGDNVAQGFIDWKTPKRWPKSDVPNVEKYLLLINDIVIAMDRTWITKGLKVSKIKHNDLPSLLLQRVARLRANALTTQDFLYLQFRGWRFEKNVKEYQKESLVPHISTKQIRDFKIPVPPLPEQQKIAQILTTWDQAIQTLTQLINTKKDQKRGLMQRLLTGEVRLKGFEESKKKVESKFAQFPSDWQALKIRDIAKEVSVKNREGVDYPVMSCTKYDGLVDSLSYFGKRVFSKDTSTYKMVRRGQFAYATNHIEEGSIGYQNTHEVGLISPMYTAFETNSLIDDTYLFRVLKSPLFIHKYSANTSASVDRRGSLRWRQFSLLKIFVPSLEEQKAIANILTTADQEITLLEAKLAEVRAQKRGLMQRLLTGQVRVTVADA
jgi:type I restriction enzyme S subunit